MILRGVEREGKFSLNIAFQGVRYIIYSLNEQNYIRSFIKEKDELLLFEL